MPYEVKIPVDKPYPVKVLVPQPYTVEKKVSNAASSFDSNFFHSMAIVLLFADSL